MTIVTCNQCGDEIDTETDDFGIVEDDGALYAGYNLYLEDDDRDASWAVCEYCRDELGFRGDTYVIAMPRYPDDPEAGDVRTVSAVVDHGVIVSPTVGRHDAVEPDSPELDLIRAYVLERELPADYFDQYLEVPDEAEWEQIGTGWHSSLEPSAVSDAVNKITRGDLGIYGPVLVKFGETRNVCSVGLTVYAPEGLDVWSKDEHKRVPFRDYLGGKKSTPPGSFGR